MPRAHHLHDLRIVMQELDVDVLANVRGGIFGLLGGLLANRPLLGGLLRGGLGNAGGLTGGGLTGGPGPSTSGAPMGGNPSAAAATGPSPAATAMQPQRASGGCGS
jgi:hypothetical protein